MSTTTQTQPTIVWKQYKLIDGTLTVNDSMNGNTVDYQAVQAGQYSPAICVRPQFDNANTTTTIGSIRLWWSTYHAKDPSGSTTLADLPGTGWVLKYYISDCNQIRYGDASGETTGETNAHRCAKMLQFLSSSERVESVATDVTFTPNDIDALASNQQGMGWCPSIWQSESQKDIGVSMQPVPFSGYKETISQHEKEYETRYGSTSWVNTVFGRQDINYTQGTLMKYAAGGTLFETGCKCNVKAWVNANDNGVDGTSGFPYIFFTIKAPTSALAGTWSGWACRISYIWPYTAPTTTV